LAAREVTIRLAKIATNIDRVSDSFYVESVRGGKITDCEEAAALARSLEEVLAGEGLS
jgi:UTP:GlnB (protein PII) uridylyltransferase